MRPARARHTALVVVLVVVAGLLGLTGPSQAAASCVGPVLGIGSAGSPPTEPDAPVTIVRDETLTVAGVNFFDGCEDTAEGTGGCRPTWHPTDPQSPRVAVPLVLRQGSRTWTLGAADASDRASSYAVRWVVRLPVDVRPGAARLEADPATLSVTITA